MDLPITNSRFVDEVAETIRRYCQGQADTHESNRLIRLAAGIAQQKLGGRLRAAASKQETSVEQQAMSVVANLFDRHGPGSVLCRALEGYMQADNTVLFRRFQSVIAQTASQALFHRWNETDPISAKLWRTLQRALRNDSRFNIFPEDKPEWVALNQAEETQLRCNPLEYIDIVRHFSQLNTPNIAISELVYEVLSYPGNGDECLRAIRIGELFSALQETRMHEIAQEFETLATTGSENPQLRLAIQKAAALTKEEISVKIQSYNEREKLESTIVGCFGDTLNDMINDLAVGDLVQSYYQYLHDHWADLTPETYRNEYRARFEYLARIAIDTFYGHLRDYYDK